MILSRFGIAQRCYRLPPGIKQSGGLFDSIKIYLYSELDSAVRRKTEGERGPQTLQGESDFQTCTMFE